jgi:hypothetical protein
MVEDRGQVLKEVGQIACLPNLEMDSSNCGCGEILSASVRFGDKNGFLCSFCAQNHIQVISFLSKIVKTI